MREELDRQLCEKYPKIFRDRNAPITQTCMAWGMSCGDGWFNIIDKLCGNMQNHIDFALERIEWTKKWNDSVNDPNLVWTHATKREVREIPEEIPQVVASQIKEKYGTLRFYYIGGDEYTDGVISMAEDMSSITCEECGNAGVLRKGGWYRTLCDEHAIENGYDIEHENGYENEY